MAIFVAWVSRVILHFQSTSCVEKFVLRCPYDSAYDTDFDMWARFVINKNVKDLNLDFHIPEWASRVFNVYFFDTYEQYTLPKDVFCNLSLKNLCVSVCNVVSYGNLRSTCLKKISFDRVNIKKDVIAEILSASPMLEYLEIRACRVPSQLVINSDSLRELVIAHNRMEDVYGEETEPSMEISAPALLSFHLFGIFRHLHNNNHPSISMSSLQRANLNFLCSYKFYNRIDDYEGNYDDDDDDDDYDDDDDDEDYKMERVVYLGELLFERLRHVAELEMGFQCIQAMLILEAKGLRSPLLGIRCLKLNANIFRHDVPGIVTLLKCTPNLEKLLVNWSCYSPDFEEFLSFPNFRKKKKSYWRGKRWMEEVPLLHLKSVKFLGYEKSEDVDKITHTLVQLILKNAPLLPNVVINVGGYEMIVTPHFA